MNEVTGFERPAPDAGKIVEAWQAWSLAADDVLPGRTMADLKIGGADKVINTIAADPDGADIGSIVDAWSGWERGRVGPEATLQALAEAGFDNLVAALSAPA